MKQAFVLMTAMPPTKGHMELIKFASELGPVTVVVGTQPDEPFAYERFQAIDEAAYKRVSMVWHHNEFVQQVPNGPDDHKFWHDWVHNLRMYGLKEGDYIVASDPYGKTLAEYANCIFMPYDLDRSIYPCTATSVRNNPMTMFSHILPEFQPNLMKTVTMFGAESCGKTTLAKAVAQPVIWTGDEAKPEGHFLPEWARPYLECVGPEINDEVMERIWEGQVALQRHGQTLRDKPFIVQDTDLFSTVGYWNMYGEAPVDLIFDANLYASDLYVICPSNIPFEPDPLRYGGDVRESTDQYWIDLCEEYNLNYIVLESSDLTERVRESVAAMTELFDPKILAYERVK